MPSSTYRTALGLSLALCLPACTSILGDFSIGSADGGGPDASSNPASPTTLPDGGPATFDAGGAGASVVLDAQGADAPSPNAPSGIFCQDLGTSCTCAAPDGRPGGGPSCSQSGVNHGTSVCCADARWPAAGTACTCKAYGCGSTVNYGCACTDHPSATSTWTSCTGGSGSPCCAVASSSGLSCVCVNNNPDGCGSQAQVSECSPVTQPCPPATLRVTSCST